MKKNTEKSIDKSRAKIVFLSTYPPRECGLATFTKAFVRIFEEFYVKDEIKVIAISDEKGKYKYSSRIVFEIDQFDQQSYVKAAEYVNQSNIEVVVLEHEYGIFGGEDGKYILKFLEKVNKPVITSFHSVLKKHSEHRFKLTQKIIDLSDSVIIMTNNAKKILLDTFHVNPKKIKIVAHGVPNVRYDEKEKVKKQLDFKNKTVLSTYGLINRGKGIENVIEALPKVVEKFPNVIYLIIGATHPTILKQEGESYRKSLIKMVTDRSLEDHVFFVNKYLDYKELVDYLKATDIYLAPQLDFDQAFSGTVSYAMGCGCFMISSPTNFANEILAGGRGIIIKPKSKLISETLLKILSSQSLLEKTRLKGYEFARSMIWPKVGLDYLKVIESKLYIKKEQWKKRIPNFEELPSLKYLKQISDNFGVIQHSHFTKPDYKFGYSLDDQSRAILVCVKYLEKEQNKEAEDLLNIYLNYLEKAIDNNQLVHNFIDKNKKFGDKIGSDASVSRSYWALSYILCSKKIDENIKKRAEKILSIYRSRIINIMTRPMAYVLLGHCNLKEEQEARRIAEILILRYRENSENGKWRWFDEFITWGNAMIPYALIKAYKLLKEEKYFKIALESLAFLEESYRYKGIPSPVGQDGWYFKNQKKAIYDQQPIEAADMVIIYNELYFITKEDRYRKKAFEWMGWFFGNNINESILYDNVSRGIYDGLTRTGVNLNEGAESIMVYLMAYLSFNKGL